MGSDGKLHFVNASGADTVLPFSSIKEQTVSKNISLGETAYINAVFIFDELTEVKGVKSINKNGSVHHTLKPVDNQENIWVNGSFLSISGNTVTINIKNQLNTGSSCEWTVTAVGI